MLKKLLCILMTIAMVFTIAPLTVFASSPAFTYSVSEISDDNTVTITVGATGMSRMSSTDIQIFFDERELEFISISRNSDAYNDLSPDNMFDFIGGKSVSADGQVNASMFYYPNAERDRNLFNVTFRVEGKASADITIHAHSWDGTNSSPEDCTITITGNGSGNSNSGNQDDSDNSDNQNNSGNQSSNAPTAFTYSVTDTYVGENVTITIGATGMSRMTSADIEIYYDENVLEFVSINKHPDANNDLSYDNSLTFVCGQSVNVSNKATASMMYWINAERDRNICSITFNVKSADATSVNVRARTWEGSSTPESINIPVEAHSHSYNQTVTAPTCTENGYTTYTCDCGASYDADYVEATDHTPGEWQIVQESTIEADGIKAVYCTVCEEELETAVINAGKTIDDKILSYYGDINGDFTVTTADARMLLRISARLDVLDENFRHLADINADGSVTVADARLALRMAARLEVQYCYSKDCYNHTFTADNICAVCGITKNN